MSFPAANCGRYQQLGGSGAVSKTEQDKASADVKNSLALFASG